MKNDIAVTLVQTTHSFFDTLYDATYEMRGDKYQHEKLHQHRRKRADRKR